MKICATEFLITWDTFETNFIDYRMLLGYKINYRIIPDGIARNFSIFEDEWQMIFADPKDQIAVIRNLQPDTWYAIYVQTLMINPAEKMNEINGGISKIHYVKTLFGFPSAVQKIQAKPKENSIVLSVLPPKFPNGQITHIMIEIREIQEPTANSEISCNLTAIPEKFDFDLNLKKMNDLENDFPDENPAQYQSCYDSTFFEFENKSKSAQMFEEPMNEIIRKTQEESVFEDSILNSVFESSWNSR